MLKAKLIADKNAEEKEKEKEEHKCQFCMNHKLQDYRIPQAKMNQLFYNDFIKCKYEAEIRAMQKEDEEDHGKRRKALE